MYLRDTAIIKHKHVDALLAAVQEVMDLIAALPKDVVALSTMTEERTIQTCTNMQTKWTKQ
jgi:hypothetical protein